MNEKKDSLSENKIEKNSIWPTRDVPLLHSIKVKAWLAIFFVTILPLLLLGFYSFNVLNTISKDLLVKSNLQAFQQVKYEVDQYVSMYEDLANFLAKDARFKDPESEEAGEALRQLDKSYEFVDRIVIAGLDGKLLKHSKKDADAIIDLSGHEESILNTSENIMFSPEAFHVKVPLTDQASSPILISTVSFLKLRKSLEGISFGTNFHYYLVTSNGENILNQPDFPKELIARLIDEPCGAYDIKSDNGLRASQVGICLPILQYNLRIFVFQDAGDVYAVASKIRSRTFIVILIIGLIAFFIGTFFSLKFTSPIIKIADKANELSAGNLKVNVKSTRKDEIGFLAICFNRMTSRIRKKVFELSTMYRVSTLINGAATYQQALDDCLTHIITVFLAQRGSIMLLTEDRTKLRVESVRLFGQIDSGDDSDKPKTRFELEVGEGIAGQVVQSGEAILCMDCKTDDRFKNYDSKNGNKAPETLISVPLIVHGTVMGVVNLADRSTNKPFTDEDLELLQAIASQMAISIDNARLHELAITDGLTKLFIHRYFQLRLDDEMKRAIRFKMPLTLVLLDIDHFKKFNDTYGHQVGDKVLKAVATMIKDSVRATDIPCRYGGEEFSIILAHTNSEQALIFAERLRERIAAYVLKNAEDELRVTISIGLAEFPLVASSKEELIRKADQALYASKDAGRNTTTIWQEDMAEVKDDEA
jgi:diguanylate cyclase (GGDEF)-like protein